MHSPIIMKIWLNVEQSERYVTTSSSEFGDGDC